MPRAPLPSNQEDVHLQEPSRGSSENFPTLNQDPILSVKNYILIFIAIDKNSIRFKYLLPCNVTIVTIIICYIH